MREIKFRVWANGTILKSDEYKDLPFYINVLDGKIYQGTTEKGDFCLIERSDFVPIQYTGFKDKNGVEIYERDIVRFNNGLWNFIGKIVFDVCFYLIDVDRLYADTILDKNFKGKYLEVIGNIYESPESLKDER